MINETHVLIDQVNSYSYGVNALIGMSKGKIVLSGAEKEAVEFMGSTVEECPIINIEPTAEDVFNKLISLLNDKKNLRERSEGGISFVQKYHSPEKISQQYETFYQSLLNEYFHILIFCFKLLCCSRCRDRGHIPRMRRWHGGVGAEYGRKPGAIAAKTGTVTIKIK